MPEANLRHRVLELQTRRSIYDAVTRVPGVHLLRLQQELPLARGTIAHHLRQLERFGLLGSRQEGRKKVYFVQGTIDPEDEYVLCFLRRRTSRWILIRLSENPRLTASDLSRLLHRRLPTISYHLRNLTNAGIIEPVWGGRVRYHRFRDPERVRRLLEAYAPTFRVVPPRPPFESLESRPMSSDPEPLTSSEHGPQAETEPIAPLPPTQPSNQTPM